MGLTDALSVDDAVTASTHATPGNCRWSLPLAHPAPQGLSAPNQPLTSDGDSICGTSASSALYPRSRATAPSFHERNITPPAIPRSDCSSTPTATARAGMLPSPVPPLIVGPAEECACSSPMHRRPTAVCQPSMPSPCLRVAKGSSESLPHARAGCANANTRTGGAAGGNRRGLDAS